MTISYEFNIEKFEAWSGGKDTKEDIIRNNKEEEFTTYVEDIFPEGCTETEMNDFLWFDRDNIYEALGLDEDGNIKQVFECPICGIEYDNEEDANNCCTEEE